VKFSPRERRLLAVLGVLGALLGLRVLWLLASPGGGTVPGLRPAAARRGGAGARSAEAIPDHLVALRTDLLEPDPERELEVGRDPFRYAPAPLPPPPPGPSLEELERRRQEEEERRRLAEEQRLEAGPQPPEFDLRYLGSFGPRRRRIAVFADASGANIYNAREGDTLDDRFVVETIGYESVDIGFVGFPDVPARRLGISP